MTYRTHMFKNCTYRDGAWVPHFFGYYAVRDRLQPIGLETILTVWKNSANVDLRLSLGLFAI